MKYKIIKKLRDEKRTYVICKKLNNHNFLLIHEKGSNMGLLVNGTQKYLRLKKSMHNK